MSTPFSLGGTGSTSLFGTSTLGGTSGGTSTGTSFGFGSTGSTGFTLGGGLGGNKPATTTGGLFGTSTPAASTGTTTAATTSTPWNASTATTSSPASSLSTGLGAPKPATTTPLWGASTIGTTPGTGTGLGTGLGGTLGSGLGSGLGSSLGTGLGASTSTTTPLSSLSTAATTTGAPTQTTSQPATTATAGSISSITFKVLEDYINKWMGDLDGHQKDFINQATQLNALDKLMIENGDKIVDINNEVDRLSSEQEQLEQELEFIYSQQNDLEKSIKKLEDGIEQMPMITPQKSDTSRIEMYKLLIEVDNQIRSMSGDLKEVIKRLNDSNVNLNDPAVQISKILNAHMDSLNWIEENTNSIQNQVEKLSKVVNERIHDTENPSRYLFS